MYIKLSPQGGWPDTTLVVIKAGDALTVNGDTFDFSDIPPGGGIFTDWDVDPPALAVPSPYFFDRVTRDLDGTLRVILILPTGPVPTLAADWPEPLVNPPDGVLDIPFSSYDTNEWVGEGDDRHMIVVRHHWHAEDEIVDNGGRYA